jgi:acetolactate synthase-1/2/3 large subunit
LVGDACLAAVAVVVAVDRRGVAPGEGARTAAVRERLCAQRRWRDVPFDDRSTAERIDPRTLTIALDDLLPEGRTVTIDSGHFMGWPTMYLAPPDARGFVFNQAYMAVGVGLGTALGAAVGAPDRLTVATVGDGGALMALGELDTAARLGLPLLVVVYNDDAYGAEVHHFPGEPLGTVTFPPADLAAIARGAGLAAATVRTLDDLAALRDWLAAPAGPLLLDAKVNPAVVGAWLEEAFRGE